MPFDRAKARAVLRDWVPGLNPTEYALDRLAECVQDDPHLLHGYTLEEWEHRAARAEARLAAIDALCDDRDLMDARQNDIMLQDAHGLLFTDEVRAILRGEAS